MSSKKKAGKAGGKEKKDSKGAKASGASKASVSISSLTASSPPSGGTNPTSDFEAGLLFSKLVLRVNVNQVHFYFCNKILLDMILLGLVF